MRRLLLACLAAAALLAGCSNADKVQMETISEPRESVVSVNVVSEAGSVTVRPGDGEAIRVESAYTVSAGSRERRALIGENAMVTTDRSDPSVLTVRSYLGNSVTLSGEEEAEIHLDVYVPQGIGSVVVQSEKGDIHIENIRSGEFSVVNSQGNVVVKDCAFTGTSNIVNVVGDVEMTLKSIDKAEEIRVTTEIGDITLNVPKNASYTITQEELDQPGLTWKNRDGKTRIRLATKTGKIRFQK